MLKAITGYEIQNKNGKTIELSDAELQELYHQLKIVFNDDCRCYQPSYEVIAGPPSDPSLDPPF